MKNIIRRHPSIAHAHDIQEICRPLQHFNISYFSHAHIDNEKRFAAICSNPGFLEHYISKKYYNADIHMAGTNKFNNFVIWDTIERSGLSEKMGIEALEFGIDHTFTIIEVNEQGKDYYHFSTHLPCKSFNQIYLRNFDLLNLFIAYFKDKIRETKILSSAYNVTYTLDDSAEGYAIKNNDVLTNMDNKRDKFIESLSLANHLTNHFIFTKREKECLLFTIRGKTAKQIARILGVSHRTIEEYLANIKVKMRVASKAEMIEKIMAIQLSLQSAIDLDIHKR